VNPLTFDTLQFARRLKKAGIKEMEAEAITEAVRDALASTVVAIKRELAAFEANLATKRDILTPEVKIAETKCDLKVKIAETKADLIRWIVSMGVLQTAIISTLILKLVSN
jgi:hypothetical protein